MNRLATVGTFVEPVTVCSPDATLRNVQGELGQGRPVVLQWGGDWHFIFPESVVGYPATRRIIDLPQTPALTFTSNTPVDTVLEALIDRKVTHALVVESDRILGVVTTVRLLSHIAAEARQAVRLLRLLETSLQASGTVVWRLPQTHQEGAGIEFYGPVKTLFGISADVLAQDVQRWAEHVHEDDRGSFQALRGQWPEATDALQRVYRFHHPTRGWRWFRDQVQVERDEVGQPLALLGVTVDVTDIVYMQEEERWLAQLYEQISRRRPGEALEKVLVFLQEQSALDAAVLLSWTSSQRGLQIEKQWIRSGLEASLEEVLTALFPSSEKRPAAHSPGELINTVLTRQEPYYITDITETGLPWADLVARQGIRALWLLPLIVREDLRVMLILMSRRVDAFSEQFRRIMLRAVPALAAAVEAWHYEKALEALNATLEERVRQRTYELQVLYEISQQIGYTLDFDELLRLMLEHLHRVVPYDVAASFLRIGDRGELIIQTARPLSPVLRMQIRQRILDAFVSLGAPAPPSEKVDIRLVETSHTSPSQIPVEQLESAFLVPIFAERHDQPIGFLFVGAERPEAFTEDQIRMLYTVANQASISIQRLHALIAAEQRRLENLVEQLPEGIVLLNRDRMVILTNPRGRSYLDVLAPDWRHAPLRTLGGNPIDEFLSPPLTGRPHEVELHRPKRQVFEIRSQPIRVGPEEGGWVLLVRDITVEREVEERVREQDRLAAIGQLAAGIAHDFNNLLTSIMGFSELILLRKDANERIKQFARIIHEQGERAATMIRQILDFARRTGHEQRPMDLVPFLKEQVKLLERTIPESIHIELRIGEGEFWVRANPVQLQQILTNLAINARDAMILGGQLTIRLDRWTLRPGQRPPEPSMPPGTYVRIGVEDTGEGIPPHILPYIFEPFFTTKGPGRGTGLGLAQVYGLVKQHNGFIEVRSEVGRGTTFFIYLPAITPVKETQETLVEGTPRGHGETILLVEDDPNVLETGEQMLTSLGYRVLVARNGQEALETFQAHADTIALVITDMVMPTLSGAELYEALRARKPDLRVIVISGYPLEESMQRLFRRKEVRWLQKPLKMEELAQAVYRELQRRPASA